MAKVEKRSFRYQRRTPEEVRERVNMRSGNFDSIIKPQFKRYSVREGKNIIRILPPTWEKPKHYGYDIYVNYNIGADNQSYLSLSKMGKGKDPIAEARRVAEAEADEKLTKALSPTHRILMWVIDRQEESEGPQLWPCPFTTDKAFLNLSFDIDTKEIIPIDDPDEGCDIRFYKEGQGMLTKYDASKMKLLPASPLSEDEPLQAEWLEFVTANPVPDCLNFYDYDYIANVFGGATAKPEAEDDIPAPAPHRRAAAEAGDEDPLPPRRRPASPPEDTDEDPVPSRRRTAAPVEDEPAPRMSIRDRIRQSRQQAEPEEDD